MVSLSSGGPRAGASLPAEASDRSHHDPGIPGPRPKPNAPPTGNYYLWPPCPAGNHASINYSLQTPKSLERTGYPDVSEHWRGLSPLLRDHGISRSLLRVTD
ncbi:hypothetical protein CRBSH125_16780 [Afipia carboxidovorans]|nr:hypothetical protein CRBSH125_16780 [Afipia carboxidovorans]